MTLKRFNLAFKVTLDVIGARIKGYDGCKRPVRSLLSGFSQKAVHQSPAAPASKLAMLFAKDPFSVGSVLYLAVLLL